MTPKWTGFVLCAILSLCHSAYVDTLNKCSFKDDECVIGVVRKLMKDTRETGISEINLPPIDPMDISGISIPVLGLFNVSVEEGDATGVKDCEIKHMHNDFDARATDLDLVCDITIKAKFKLDDISPLVQKLFGADAVSANGNMMLKIDRIHMTMKFFYDIIKKDDGNIYFDLHKDDLIANFDIGNLKMTADKMLFGTQDLSNFVEKFFNENWRSMIPNFITAAFRFAVTIVRKILGIFFDNVPSKYYYIEDLTQYVNKP